MRRFPGRVVLLTVALAFAATPARAQWGGWGGGATVQGSMARGMGMYAAGAGEYNVQTAQARSINANTRMQVNQYMYLSQQESNRREYERMSRRQGQVNATADATYRRLHDNPDPRDVHTGDALNVVLDELTNPKVYTQVVEKATQTVPSKLVKNIPFQYAAKMISICLTDVGARGVPDELATNPAFENDRQTLRALMAKVKDEAHSQDQVSLETLRSCRVAIKAVQEKVARMYPVGTRNRSEADNYLKALYGLTKMLETPSVDKFLVGLNNLPTTTLGHLVTFMHSFNLRFGVAKNPTQEATYDQLYPLLVALRDRAQVQTENPLAASSAAGNPKAMNELFSGMSYDQVQPQSGRPVPPPPPAQEPR